MRQNALRGPGDSQQSEPQSRQAGNQLHGFSVVLEMDLPGQTDRPSVPLIAVLLASVAAGMIVGAVGLHPKASAHTAELASESWSKPPARVGPPPQIYVAPLGGRVLDGVYRASGGSRAWVGYPLATLSGCSAAPNAGIRTSRTLRTSSKL
jgi:hypothetical protein